MMNKFVTKSMGYSKLSKNIVIARGQECKYIPSKRNNNHHDTIRMLRTSASNSMKLEQDLQDFNDTIDKVQGTETISQSDEFTNKLLVIDPSFRKQVAKFRILEPDGRIAHPLHESLTEDKLVDLYEGMVRLNVFDNLMYECQRQGRISFYMTHFGEEATQFGSAGALEPEDIIFAQYREAGILFHRKMSIDLMIGQCLGNCDDLGKGRQMPIHYGNRALNYVTISSPLGTQLPQAVGAAYSLKRSNDANDRIVVCYFGEGAASEGDAYAGFNFAATLSCPVLFFCRNNGYAISTPASEQYRGDGIISRSVGCGISSIRVDGNDLLAVYEATRVARRYILEYQKPFLIEAITYRVGHHSTSDDSSAYRSNEEIKEWKDAKHDPIARFRTYLTKERQLWSDEREKELRNKTRIEVLESLSSAEKKQKLPISSMFDDVYDKQPEQLKKQSASLKRHLATFGDEYQLKEYQSE